jgi:PhoPQ-activated pathogenicity-related protein
MRFQLLLIAFFVAAYLITPVFADETATPPGAADALQKYIAAEDESYGWTKRREGALGAGTYVELTLTSQTWRDVVWKHQLFVYRPSTVEAGAQAILLINGGRWNDSLAEPPANPNESLPREALLIATLAETLKAPVAVLMHVPQQPMFGGMVEDEIISLTFQKYMETGDDSWPLLLPMVKSAVRAMDAVQELAASQWQLEVPRFIVTGASKRGWTTWLTAAVDPRVGAIAPMVIDMLNMTPHMELQRLSYGEASDEIEDYTEKGLHKHLKTDRGIALQAIVDPYSYRALLQQPKLIILGTNDRYWPVDALNLYWDALEGEKHILYVPNNGHGINDYQRVLGTMAGLYASLNGGPRLPKLQWTFSIGEGVTRLEVTADTAPNAARAWVAAADTRDFRSASWKSQPLKKNGEGESFVFELSHPRQGFAAVFAEAQFNGNTLPLYLSTTMQVLESEK